MSFLQSGGGNHSSSRLSERAAISLPSRASGIKTLMGYAGEVAQLPQNQRLKVCMKAKTQYADSPNGFYRIRLAVLASVVPGCISPDQQTSLLQESLNHRGSSYYGVAQYLSAITRRQQKSEQALSESKRSNAALHKKLKALTHIETQVNQIKTHELQNLN
ncbi:hypothetical protein [Acidihalobacter prosperus]